MFSEELLLGQLQDNIRPRGTRISRSFPSGQAKLHLFDNIFIIKNNLFLGNFRGVDGNHGRRC